MKSRKLDVGRDVVLKDLETPGEKNRHQDLCLWLRLLTLHKLIDNEMGRRLREYYGMSLARFHLLAQLSVAPNGLLVERVVDPSNRRANLVYMTKKGRALFDDAARTLESWIKDFFSVYSGKDKELLFRLLGKQKAFVLKRLKSANSEAAE